MLFAGCERELRSTAARVADASFARAVEQVRDRHGALLDTAKRIDHAAHRHTKASVAFALGSVLANPDTMRPSQLCILLSTKGLSCGTDVLLRTDVRAIFDALAGVYQQIKRPKFSAVVSPTRKLYEDGLRIDPYLGHPELTSESLFEALATESSDAIQALFQAAYRIAHRESRMNALSRIRSLYGEYDEAFTYVTGETRKWRPLTCDIPKDPEAIALAVRTVLPAVPSTLAGVFRSTRSLFDIAQQPSTRRFAARLIFHCREFIASRSTPTHISPRTRSRCSIALERVIVAPTAVVS